MLEFPIVLNLVRRIICLLADKIIKRELNLLSRVIWIDDLCWVIKKKKKMTIKSIPLWSHDSWQPAGGARTKFLLKTRRRHLGEVNNQFWTWSPILKPVCLTSVVDGSCSMLFYSYNKTYCINTLITIHWFNIIVLLRYNISANLYSMYTILCTCFSFFFIYI